MKKIIVILSILGMAACGTQHTDSSVKVDTTGCSQLIEKKMGIQTAHGFILEVASKKSFKDSCWNAKDSGYSISYSWQQTTEESEYRDISFWTSSNGAQNKIPASYVICNPNSLSGTFPQPQTYTCVAEAFVRLGYTGDYNIEIAPYREGEWDTKSFENNYFFKI